MENKQQLLHRLAALLVMLLLCAGLAGSRLVDLQLVHGQEYLERSAQFLTTTSTVSAARGEILDRYGRPMVSNKTGFSLVLLYSDLSLIHIEMCIRDSCRFRCRRRLPR